MWLNDILQQFCYRLQKRIYPIPRVMDRLETSRIIAENESLSVARFGDGELGLILHSDYSIGFQQYDPKLATRLREVLQDETQCGVLLCIPNVFDTIAHMNKKPRLFWLWWVNKNRRTMRKLLKQKTYGDAFVTRLYLPWIDKSNEKLILENLKKAWCGKKVVVVEGVYTRWGVGNDLLDGAIDVRRIICPAKNAFEKYERILEACRKNADPNSIFVLAIGPTATVLAYDLAKLGIRALDMGHLDLQYEYLRREASEKMHIPGKYNNELHDTMVEPCQNQKYLQSIIADISDG